MGKDVIEMLEVQRDHYVSVDGWTMRREYGLTPNGNPMNGRWVLRDEKGEMMGFDTYQNDLAEHYGLSLRSQP